MIGPLLAMAAANFAGATLRAPGYGRPFGQIVIASALGLYFTPAIARQVVSYWPLLLAAAIFAIALGALSGWVLRRLTGIDGTTAFFASVPGGAAEMTRLGDLNDARPDRVALAQSLRILIVVVVVPFALTYSGVHGSDRFEPGTLTVAWQPLLELIAIAAIAGIAAFVARMPNPFMLGPLLAVVALTASEVRFSAIPVHLTNAAQVLIGCSLGERFERRFVRSVPRFAAGVVASVAVAIAASAAFGVALATFAGLPAPSLILATAPGGMAEMCITAKVLQLGVPLVTAAQITRMIILVGATGAVFKFVRRIRGARDAG
jgi:hypothetical protein